MSSIEGIRIQPTSEAGDRAPQMVSHVRVEGSTDATVVSFLYVSGDKLQKALKGQSGPGISFDGATAVVSVEPLARLALPLTVALEMFAQLAEVAASGTPDVVAQFTETAERIKSVFAEVGPAIQAVMPKPEAGR